MTLHGRSGTTIVNCTGMGLQWEGGYDKKCFPIRGQTLLVRPTLNTGLEQFTVANQLRDNKWTFFIFQPLFGGCIVDGTKQSHDRYSSVKKSDFEELKKRAAVLYPERMKVGADGKKYFDVVKVNVDFRPANRQNENFGRKCRRRASCSRLWCLAALALIFRMLLGRELQNSLSRVG